MSLNNALNTATMGLRAAQTLSRVNSENVANATSEGYARRRALTVSGDPPGTGPIVSEIRREVDAALSRVVRNEIGKVARHQVVSDALNNYTAHFGMPGDGLSPADKFSEFSSSLTTFANNPASNEAQYAVLDAAEGLTNSLRGASTALAAVRNDVDMEIRYEVSELNQSLYDLAELNKRLVEATRNTPEAAQIGDRIDGLLDKVAGIADIRSFSNADGSINVYTTGGAALLERTRVQDVIFNPGDGSLTAGRQEVTPNKDGIRGLSEGSLAGLLQLKREIIPRFQLQLDEFARGLIVTFESSDPTLSGGGAGLFTDAGSALDTTTTDDLAFRIRVNNAVNPKEGGQLWRLRDGINASSPGEASNNTLIRAQLDALQQPFSSIATAGVPGSIKMIDFAAHVVSLQSFERARSQETALAYSTSAAIVQASRENFEGVNIDEEMQDLQLIQQSYAANARVLTTVLGMIDTLLDAV